MFNSHSGRYIPPVTKNLIIINVIVWVLCAFSEGIDNMVVRYAGLHFIGSELFNPLQLVTYMFVHARTFTHILFNMFSLYMFGRILEQVWGGKRFLYFYFVCGIGAAFMQELVWWLTWQNEYISGIAALNGLTFDTMKGIVDKGLALGDAQWVSAVDMFKSQMVTVGASGAVFGILLGFAFVFPNMPLYLFFIPVPVKAKYMVAGYAVLEFIFGVSNSMSTVAHFAHLGGMLFGLVILLIWKKQGRLNGGYFF